MGRIFAIPDIHGRLDLLEKLFGALNGKYLLNLEEGQDKVIFLGDYVDRGPDSAGVLNFVRGLVDAYPTQVVALAGNHEWIMIDACVKKSYDHFGLWLSNGGGATLRSYPGEQVPDDVIRWLASLPLYHKEPGFFFSHAPLPTERLRRPHHVLEGKDTPSGFAKSELIWTYFPEEGKAAHKFHQEDGVQVVGVCGHIHGLPKSEAKPRFFDHYIFADSGCGCWYKAPLVAIEVRTRETIFAYPVEAMESQSAV